MIRYFINSLCKFTKMLHKTQKYFSLRQTIFVAMLWIFCKAILVSKFGSCSLSDRESSGRFICDKCKAKEVAGNINFKSPCNQNYKRHVLAHLNINYLGNKSDTLTQLITNDGILVLLGTKFDSFPEGQFLIPVYETPYEVHWNWQRGGIMLYVRDDIPSILLSVENSPTEDFYIELNLAKKEWLLCSS